MQIQTIGGEQMESQSIDIQPFLDKQIYNNYQHKSLMIYIPKIQIVDLSIFLQVLSLPLTIYVIRSLSKNSTIGYFQRILIIINPLTIHYFYFQPSTYIACHLALLSCLNHKFRPIACGFLIAIHPQFLPIAAGFNKNQVSQIFLSYSLLLLIGYLMNHLIYLPQSQYPFTPIFEEPSLNLIWLLQTHMFNNFQYLYNIFIIGVVILSVFPLSFLPLPSLMTSTIGFVLGVYSLQFCALQWHWTLGILYFLNFKSIYLKNENDRKIIKILGLVSSVGSFCFCFFTWSVIKKWSSDHQLNTGHVLLFMVILWLLQAIFIVEIAQFYFTRNFQVNNSKDIQTLFGKITSIFLKKRTQIMIQQ